MAGIEEIIEEMCDDYCRYPREWDAEAEGCDLSESDVCASCPMNKLLRSEVGHG